MEQLDEMINVAQSIRARVYGAFFERLSSDKEVRPETLAALRRLYSAGRLERKLC